MENVESQLQSVVLNDGTRLQRLGPQRWVANPDHPRATEWIGDIIRDENGAICYIYKYAKFLSQSNIEMRFADGSKLACREPDGTMSLPGIMNGLGIRTPEENALFAISDLQLQVSIPISRLRLLGMEPADDLINCNFLVNLSSAEANALKEAVANSSKISENSKSGSAATYEIVDASVRLRPKKIENKVFQRGSAIGAVESNLTGAINKFFIYDSPRPDHTATTVIFFVSEEDMRLKVVTGTRGNNPYKGREALLGGFVDMKDGKIEEVQVAAEREIKEETHGRARHLQLIRVSDARKDPRNQVIDSQFVAQISESEFRELKAGDDVAALHSRDVAVLLGNDNSLAFDHDDALRAALEACKTRGELRLAAFNTVRDMAFDKVIRAEEKRFEILGEKRNVDADEANPSVSATFLAVLAALRFLKVKRGASNEEIESAITHYVPQCEKADLDFARARARQIEFEEIDYQMSRAGWTADLSDPTSSETVETPVDVSEAIRIASHYEELSDMDRQAIRNLEKVLLSDPQQRTLLENGYRKNVGYEKATRVTQMIAFFLSYCGRNSEDFSA